MPQFSTIADNKKDGAWIIPGKYLGRYKAGDFLKAVASGAIYSHVYPPLSSTFKMISTLYVKIHFVIRITEAGDLL